MSFCFTTYHLSPITKLEEEILRNIKYLWCNILKIKYIFAFLTLAHFSFKWTVEFACCHEQYLEKKTLFIIIIIYLFFYLFILRTHTNEALKNNHSLLLNLLKWSTLTDIVYIRDPMVYSYTRFSTREITYSGFDFCPLTGIDGNY